MNMLSTERTTVRKTGEQGIMVRNMLGTFEIFITPGMTKEHAAGKLHVSATGNGRTFWKHVIPRLLHFLFLTKKFSIIVPGPLQVNTDQEQPAYTRVI